jgi:hypothetical protein
MDNNERKRRQAQARREQKRAAATNHNPSGNEQPEPKPGPGPAALDNLDADRQAIWRRAVKCVRLWRQRNELDEFKADLDSDRPPKVADRALMRAALALTQVDIGAWIPAAPTVEQLSNLDAWVEQVEADHRRNTRNRKWERELLGLPKGGNGKPVRLQQSKYSQDELLQRLEHVIAWHDNNSRGFQRRFLDPNCKKYFIAVEDGGIANKQVKFLANMIVGNTDERPFEESWKIVQDYRAKRRNEAADEQAELPLVAVNE